MTSPTVRTSAASCCLCGASKQVVVASGRDFEYATCDNTFQYVRCVDCSHMYLSPRPDPSALGIIYPANYGNYSNSRTPSLTFRVKNWLEGRTLRALVQLLKPGFSALDVGCGDGRLLDNLRVHCPTVGHLAGIEISPIAAEAAIGKGYPVHVGTVHDYAEPDGSFDLIFLIQVIEHVFNPGDDVRRLYHLLKPGGLIVFETPSVRCLDFWLFRGRYWGGYHFPRHFHLFSPEGFSRLLRETGFEILSIKPKLQPVHWVWSFHHLFQEWKFPRWWTGLFHIKNAPVMAVCAGLDLLQFLPFRRSSNMQVIARKPEVDAAE